METVATPAIERGEKRARDLRRGNWTAVWYPAKVLYAEGYIERGREKVLVVSRDPHYLRPEVDIYDADFRLPMAAPDEIPEDPNAFGRELDDESGLLPSWV